MKIDNISSAALQALNPQKGKKEEGDFSKVLTDFLADVNGDLKKASAAQEKIVKGNVDDMVQLMSTIEKSDISLRLLTEVRNKALEAYQEIMRMQV